MILRMFKMPLKKGVLKYFSSRGWFNNDEIEKILSYEETGFSLDANVKIQAWDHEGVERLIRYCARPAFAMSTNIPSRSY